MPFIRPSVIRIPSDLSFDIEFNSYLLSYLQIAFLQILNWQNLNCISAKNLLENLTVCGLSAMLKIVS